MKPSPSARFALRFVACWAAYSLTGLAMIGLAGPASFAAPLYPATGVALACVLVWGTGMLPAIVLGSITVGLGASASGNLVGAQWLWIPAWIGVGAALQAWLGAFLVGRRVGQPLTLDEPRDMIVFFVRGGALACLVNASLAVLVFGIAGRSSNAWHDWWTWWSGDVLGVAIGAPIALTLIGKPRQVWRDRLLPVGLTLSIVTLLLVLGHVVMTRWERQRTQANFERVALAAVRSIDARLQDHLDALEAMHSVFVANGKVTREEFHQASAAWAQRMPSLQLVGWFPRVARVDVPAFEATAQAEGAAGFRVFDRPDATAPASDEVLAMRFVEPSGRNNADALGLNVLSAAPARTAVARTRETAESAATEGFRLLVEREQQTGVMIYRAVFAGNPTTPAERLAATRGLVAVGMRMDETLRLMRRFLPAYLDVCLLDTTPGISHVRLAGTAECAGNVASDRRLSYVEALPFAGRQWQVRVHAPVDAWELGTLWSASRFSITGLLGSSLLGALLLTITGRRRRTEAAVKERTAELEHEIGERMRTESALRRSEHRSRQLFDAAPVGVVHVDMSGCICDVNPAFCQISGRDAVDLVGRSMRELTHSGDAAIDADMLRDLASGAASSVVTSTRLITASGATRWARCHVRVAVAEPDAPQQAVAVVEDITEHLRLEEAERAREAAELANQAKTEFLSRMSHELRTPLNAMLGFAQLLEIDRAPTLSATQRGWTRQIQQAGWHLLEMINDILDLSRIESGTLKLDLVPTDLDAAITAARSMVEPAAAARGVTLHEAPSAGPLTVLGDETRVRQILTNLLSNAIKYNVEDGRVLIATERVGAASVEISVSDTGPGMNTEQLAQLFQPFNRLGRERGKIEGTGIGLVISRRLAELMGGTLRAHSVVGSGSSFTLTLPLSVDIDLAVIEQAEPTVPDVPEYHRRLVHYIEDNAANADVMRGILAQRPQVLLEVSSTAAAGLAAVRERLPHLVLLDMHLPDLDGLEILRHLKADRTTRDIPVIVVSADALADRIDAALEAGAALYLTKPVSVPELLASLDELLTQQASRF